MNTKIAAILLAASMLTTPALAASVANSPDTPTATMKPQKVTVTSDKGGKKHRVHAGASHGHKAHHAKHAKPNQVRHVHRISKKKMTSAGTKSQARAIETAPAKAPVKN